jgi:hypothetical protein
MGESKRKRQAEGARHAGDDPVVQGRELVPFVSLEDRAASIRSYFVKSLNAELDASDYRCAAGRELLAVRALLNHGEWLPWLRANFPWSIREAQRLIRCEMERTPEGRGRLDSERAERQSALANATACRISDEPTPVEADPSAPNDGMGAAAEWLLENMPDGINETLRGVLEPMARLPIARLLDALKVLDFEPLPLVNGAFIPVPVELAAAA